MFRDSQLKSKTRLQKNRTREIIHFTVTSGNEANVDLVLIRFWEAFCPASHHNYARRSQKRLHKERQYVHSLYFPQSFR